MDNTTQTEAAPMTATEARKVFDDARAAETDPDKRANLELLREYFCNPDFRTKFHDFAWQNRVK